MTPLLPIYFTLLHDTMSMLFLSWRTILRDPIALPDRADEMTREKVDSVQPLGIIRVLSSLVGLPSGKSSTCSSLFLAVSSSMIKNPSEYIVLT
jgi:hypothetical protein